MEILQNLSPDDKREHNKLAQVFGLSCVFACSLSSFSFPFLFLDARTRPRTLMHVQILQAVPKSKKFRGQFCIAETPTCPPPLISEVLELEEVLCLFCAPQPARVFRNLKMHRRRSSPYRTRTVLVPLDRASTDQGNRKQRRGWRSRPL